MNDHEWKDVKPANRRVALNNYAGFVATSPLTVCVHCGVSLEMAGHMGWKTCEIVR